MENLLPYSMKKLEYGRKEMELGFMFIFIDHLLQLEIAKSLIYYYEIQLKLLVDQADLIILYTVLIILRYSK